MDCNKAFDELKMCMENFSINEASKLLSDAGFIRNNGGDIVDLLGNELTEENLKNRPNYFNFCEKKLLQIAQMAVEEEIIFNFLELINTGDCKLSSSVLAAVTILENMEHPNVVYLDYLLLSTFNHLFKMDDINLKEILLSIIKLLVKLNKHFQHEESILHYFTRVAFLVIRVDIHPSEFVNILSDIISDPFSLLEHEFKGMKEKLYMASFFYLYFNTGMLWGPKIYNQFYVLEKCSNLALSVFENNNFGKSFAKLILKKYKDNEIPVYLLNKYHEDFFMEATQSSVYNEEYSVRKESIETLIIYMYKLSTDAQYIFFKYAFSNLTDCNIRAELMINMEKIICLKVKFKRDLGYFQGIRLIELVRLCCNIPGGTQCQVVENKEQILSAITLVYVLNAYNKENKIPMGDVFLNDANNFAKIVQEAIDYTQVEFKRQSINDKDSDLFKPLTITEVEKQNIIAQYHTAIHIMQSNLDLLKGVLKISNRKK